MKGPGEGYILAQEAGFQQLIPYRGNQLMDLSIVQGGTENHHGDVGIDAVFCEDRGDVVVDDIGRTPSFNALSTENDHILTRNPDAE